ncbi:hypothetical protein FISHEDRAFT_68320 [Fistulina hepatica ATCC 64428]|uniref:Uncharacterized protein n=1 Tax=Fistulina hepatica ATCC 64428 TaxID=1128425 RepID=A0A0D7AQ03_9AGAR|nr:hypothetical protein FISHEDRAFT_68320 [Fistulina hepatica ATCC 64428]
MPSGTTSRSLCNYSDSRSGPVPALTPSAPALSATMPDVTSVVPLDASAPTIFFTRIDAADFEHAPLSRDLRNWHTWHLQIGYVLAMSGQAQLILNGTLPCPDAITEPNAHMNWLLSDNAIRAFCLQNMSPAEETFASQFSTSHTMWSALAERHTNQILDMLAILELKYSLSESITDTTDDIMRRADAVYKIGVPTAEMFKILFIVNALSDPIFAATRKRIINDIEMSTSAHPYTLTSLMAALNSLRMSMAFGAIAPAPLALSAHAARTDTATPISRCTNIPNCKRPKTHTWQYCTATGGGMAGRSISEAQDKRRADESKPPRNRDRGRGGKNFI